jgi:3-oxoacyl-[acyl-carrier protein] reductase
MQLSFDGRCVIVTGAAHGLGRAMTLAFAARGATVWAVDILAEKLQATLRLAASYDGTVTARTLDVTDRRAVADLIAEAETAGGLVDILVNSAGGVRDQVGQPLEQVSERQWQEIFDVNVTGVFNLVQAVVPAMKRAGRGSIVNISSRAGLGTSLTGIQAYAAAKAGQIGLTRQLAHELGPFGIRVNSVAPGLVRSNPATERQWQAYGPEVQQRIVEGIALRRLGRPEDIAHAVLFLASDYAAWITGQVLSVDGGS